MSRPDDGDRINAAFDELIAREWPEPPRPAADDPAPYRHLEDDPPTLFDWVDPDPVPAGEPEYTLDHVEPDPEPTDDDWRPEPTPLLSRFAGLSAPGALGAGLLALSMVLTVAMVFVPGLRGWGGFVALGCFAAGLVILFSRLPRDRPPSGSGDGAVV
ncbi:MAG: hypothetical protein GXX86_12610 [Propionibacterium sp.]|nr:hypothetical protein [Propionibacterium sp.]